MEKEYPWLRINPGVQPLSSDSYIIKGENEYWIFDAGNNDESYEAIESLNGKKNLIISHFHGDHIGNVKRLHFDNIYVSKYTKKYIDDNSGVITIVDHRIEIKDTEITIEIIPMPSSHSKGSLAMILNGEYVFMGDSFYGANKEGYLAYNVSLLKEQIECLKALKADKCVISHEFRPVYHKEALIRNLERFYAKREKDNPYIYMERN